MTPAPRPRPAAADPARMLRRVSTLAAMGAEALAGGDGFEVIEPELRAAIAALPEPLRERVLIEWPAGHPAAPSPGAAAAALSAPCALVPLAVMDRLTADVRAAIEADRTDDPAGDPGGAPTAGRHLDGDEAEAMGRFWVRVAALLRE